jgi:hypothetical protein
MAEKRDAQLRRNWSVVKPMGLCWSESSVPRRRRFRITLAAVASLACLALCASSARAAFQSSPLLDNFAADPSLNTSHWTTPALGEPPMQLDASAHELTGTSGTWSAALWNARSFAAPVEVWATIHRAGNGDATLYANVSGGTSETVHPTSGYFVDFAGAASGGWPNQVSLVRIDGPQDTTRLTFVRAPYTSLAPGDQIGLSINGGVVIAWYKPAGTATWTALVSTFDQRYASGSIAIEAIPGTDYGFSNFGGGTPTAPVRSTQTRTTVAASAASVAPGGPVTYSATVSPAPSAPRGTIEFLDNNAVIPACAAVPLDAGGHASCTVTYGALGTHIGSAIYIGSPDGAWAGSENDADAIVSVGRPTVTKLSPASTTPLVGRTMLYSARVNPTPDGGTVQFTDNGKAIAGCATRPVTRGLASCSTRYRAPGVHRISSAYGGDSNYAPSAGDRQTVTVSSPPLVHTASQRVILVIACPRQSGGCRISARPTLKIPGVRHAVGLVAASHVLRAGRSGRLLFRLSRNVHAALHNYVLRHRHGRLKVTVRLTIRDGNGSRGTQTVTSVIAGRNLARL